MEPFFLGLVVAIVFLLMNNIDINADEEELEAMVRSVAEGKTGKTEVSDFFRRNCVDSSTHE